MDSQTINSDIFTFEARCHGGPKEISVLCPVPVLREFWGSFARECRDIDSCEPSAVRQFIALACRPEPAAMLLLHEQDFLLSWYSLRQWFLYWKGLNLPFPEYAKRRFVHMAVYVVRYCLSLGTGTRSLSEPMLRMVEGKELATFILDHWDGNGIVGVTTTSDSSRTVMQEFHFANTDLGHIYRNWFESGIPAMRVSEFAAFADLFEESLGDYAPGIHAHGDFSEATLLRQAAFFRKRYLTEPSRAQKALRHIVGFYRFIVNTEEGCDIFAGGNFSAGLLRNMRVLGYLSEGWEFVHYKAIGPQESRQRLVVVLKDMGGLGTRYVDGDAISVNLSAVETEYYRNLVWRYIRSRRTVLMSGNNLGYIAEALHVIEMARANRGGSRTVLTSSDVLLLREMVIGKKIQDQTVILILNALRAFFSWTDRENLLKADTDIVLSGFKYRSEGVYQSKAAKAIPIEDYDRLLGRLAMESERSYRAKLVFAIVNIIAMTGFRPSQVCKMDTQSVRLIDKMDYCLVKNLKKTSRGDKSESIVTIGVYNILENIIEESSSLREKCYDPAIRDLIFIYQTANGVDYIREVDVKQAMEQACDVLEMPRWTPYSLRRLHATIWDELDRQLGYHGELAAQAMGHKYYKTTRHHYIDRTFKEFRRVQDADLISTDEMMRREYEQILQGGHV